jgi:phosphoglycerate dehydrogenase-like enzyme
MAQETIVFAQGIEMPPHIQALAQSLKPAEFALRALPSTAKPEDIAAAMRDAEYLVGFLRFLPDEAYLEATRLKLVQVLSAGYDAVNIAGARKAGSPSARTGGQLRGRVRARRAADPVRLPEDRGLPSERGRRTLARIPASSTSWNRGKTVGIVGLGNIGEKTARRLGVRLQPRVLRHRPAQREEEQRLGVLHPLGDLARDLRRGEPPRAPERSTRHMIDAGPRRMKPSPSSSTPAAATWWTRSR